MEKSYSRKILAIGALFLFLGASATIGVSASRAWSDNFDSYTDGQLLDGTSDDGGWTGWNNDPAAAGMVTDAQARSAPYSDQVWVTTDNVHEYSETAGQWVYTAWQYCPTDMTGISYFILLSGYDGGGAGTVWTVQLSFDPDTNIVSSEFDGNAVPLTKGQWCEIRCEINLDTDNLAIFYNQMLIVEKTWSETAQGTGGGPMAIAAVDLWSNGCSPIYYDDMSLLPAGGQELLCDAGGPYTGEINVPVQFTGFASGGTTPYTWAWTFGNGGTATVQNPTHTYTTPGVFNVTLTVTDATMATVSDQTTATITAPQPVLEIGTITGGFGVKAVVKNTGAGAATNVDWTIALDGKLVFVGKSSTGTIASLAAGAEEPIKAGFILGFGKTNIVVSATCDEGATAELTKTAFVLGPFVLGVK